MFVYVVSEVWHPHASQGDDEKIMEIFAHMADAETYVWRMEEKAPSNWAVKNNMGTLHYFVVEMEVNPYGCYDGMGL